jgi:hypothetical protein
MTATVRVSNRRWASAHRAALAIVILSMALAATLGLFAARLASSSPSAPASSVSDVHPQPTDDGCLLARPGGPC